MKTCVMGRTPSVRSTVAGVLVAFGLLGGVPSAQAAGALMACPLGLGEMTFTPALTGTPQNASVSTTINYGVCWARRSLTRTSATASSENVFPAALCDAAPSLAPERLTLKWENGETSVLELVYEGTEVRGMTTVATFSGSVVEGRFQGASATQAWAYPTQDLANACLAPDGLARASALVSLAIE
ncbi:hypothetical protein [Stigmatella erecta]|uniref:Uncharacterized protein n=1 Tax=Stigmatella erecta TaxID=83460 RepID=A0A1I0K400_9BACT|nr:hypothetical protein [Stigmatella erecta]SEU18176.1 hypothetical protein SAMN05443639_10951 [Stigmatella erecta]